MKKNILISLLCVCGLALSGCGTAQSGERTADAIEDSGSIAEDIVRDEPETQNVITLDNDDISFSGGGVEIADDGDIHISEGGVYRITGHSDDQHIVVKPGENESVTVILDNCSITCVDDDVLYFKSAASAEVILSAGTQNTLISSKTISEETEADEDEDASGAVIRAKCSLTLGGDGALSVEGAVNNGIAATGALVVESGTYVVSAANDALKSREDLTIDGGSISLTASGDAVQADGDIIINGGDLTLTTGTGAADAEMKVSDSLMMGNFGGFGGGQRRQRNEASDEADDAEPSSEPETKSEVDSSEEKEEATSSGSSREPGRMPWDSDDDDTTPSRKGLKADGSILINGGTVSADTEDDAIHAGGDVLIAGGESSLMSGDDGVHADGSLSISDGSVTVSYCYEGLEATYILIEGGLVDVTATDDGMNVNGGDFGMMMRGMFGSGEASSEAEDNSDGDDAENSTPVLRITGGTIFVDSGGDGLDSNGDIYIEGGNIFVSGPSSDWDAAIDYGDGMYDFVITGGTLMAAGYSGMAESPDKTDDSQCSIYYRTDSASEDGSSAVLTDPQGNVILEYSFSHGYNCVILSSPELTVGETYTLSIGDQSYDITLADTTFSNRSSRGGMPGGSREMMSSAEPES